MIVFSSSRPSPCRISGSGSPGGFLVGAAVALAGGNLATDRVSYFAEVAPRFFNPREFISRYDTNVYHMGINADNVSPKANISRYTPIRLVAAEGITQLYP
jgi:hypothetical protein